MATHCQITFDAADPHRLARFWAEALHYRKEDHSALVGQLLAAGHLRADEVIEDEGGQAFRDVAACSDPENQGPRLFFQRVPEPKSAKNRVHLDLHVGRDQAQAEMQRLIGLGATYLWTSTDRGGPCYTLRDPEGDEFCVE
ncbi:MAG TPA: VOC family protein [Dehalococcoidia bacterium]|nr:VOC family protein [Dehalococcoidia bacterium]